MQLIPRQGLKQPWQREWSGFCHQKQVSPLHLCGRVPHDRRQDKPTPDLPRWYQGKSMPVFLFLTAPLWREFLTNKSQRRNSNCEQFCSRGVWGKGGLRDNSDSEQYFFYLTIYRKFVPDCIRHKSWSILSWVKNRKSSPLWPFQIKEIDYRSYNKWSMTSDHTLLLPNHHHDPNKIQAGVI